MPVMETSIHKAWGFSTYFFHTLIKQRLISKVKERLRDNISDILARLPIHYINLCLDSFC